MIEKVLPNDFLKNLAYLRMAIIKTEVTVAINGAEINLNELNLQVLDMIENLKKINEIKV